MQRASYAMATTKITEQGRRKVFGIGQAKYYGADL